MRLWPRRRRREVEDPRLGDAQWISPIDKDVLRDGDPGFEIFQRVMETGKPVRAIYDGTTGEVVAIEDIEDS